MEEELNKILSFDSVKEKDRTRHVHGLHPYKGKFIPQLVEYFIGVYFKKADIILDPFCGSGTTLVVATELGIHSVGVDVSRFNCMISDVKLYDYDFELLSKDIKEIIVQIAKYEIGSKVNAYERELAARLAEFNNIYFPKLKINDEQYVQTRANQFFKIYEDLLRKYGIGLGQERDKTFLEKWFIKNVREEIDFVFEQVRKVEDSKNKQAIALILSRTIRSSRATKHSDLATLKSPQFTPYYCFRHKRICKPLFSIKRLFTRYAYQAYARLKEFNRLKTQAHAFVLSADSRTVDINDAIVKKDRSFEELMSKQKIRGIFTSPPYLGQIDYHEQHSYAYDLFGFIRHDALEIGSRSNGQGVRAKRLYVEGVADVLINCKKFLVQDYNVFIVVNDRFNLYPTIIQKSGMRIVQEFKRQVLNRSERNKSSYSESIFLLKDQKAL